MGMLESLQSQLIIMGALLVLSGFFSGSETALFSLSKFKIRRFENSKDAREKRIAGRLKNPLDLIVDINLGNNLVNIAAASFATSIAMAFALAAGYGASAGVVASILIMTPLLLLFGEVVPKILAVRNPEAFSRTIIRLLGIFSYVTLPLRRMLIASTQTIVRYFVRLLGFPSYQSMTEDEIKTIVEVSEKEGVLDSREREMIHSVLDFTDTVVKEIMKPRVDIKAINKSWKQKKVLSYIRSNHVSKLPVYEGSIDKVIGVVYAKQILLNPEKEYHELIQPVLFVPDTKKIYTLLNEFKAKRKKVAIVIDEYGGTYGLITMEDILEEIFGEIHDEFEIEERILEKVDKRTYRVKGRADIDDVNRELKLKLSTEESDTINGLILAKLGRLPVENELVRIGNVSFTIEKILRRRVVTALMTIHRRARKHTTKKQKRGMLRI